MVNAVTNKENIVSKQLVNRVLEDIYIDLMATKCDTVEECRILWKTYNSLKLWFEILSFNLEELGFELREKMSCTSLQSIFAEF